jgi:hypothetical protein
MYFHYKICIQEKCLQNENDKFQKSSRPSTIDAWAHYWAAARRLRSPDLDNVGVSTSYNPLGLHSLLQGQLYLFAVVLSQFVVRGDWSVREIGMFLSSIVYHTELLGVWTSSIVRCSGVETRCFGNWICFHPQV